MKRQNEITKIDKTAIHRHRYDESDFNAVSKIINIPKGSNKDNAMTQLIDKTTSFVNEIKRSKLQMNVEQQRIYNAFVFRRVKPYKFSVIDNYGNTIRFTLYTNKRDDGVVHILTKHYQGRIGCVNAIEILNLCDVIRKGEISINNGCISYKLVKAKTIYILTVGLKRTKSGENVLKSFYSNKKTSRTAGSRT